MAGNCHQSLYTPGLEAYVPETRTWQQDAINNFRILEERHRLLLQERERQEGYITYQGAQIAELNQRYMQLFNETRQELAEWKSACAKYRAFGHHHWVLYKQTFAQQSPSIETGKEVYDLTSESLPNINSAAETTQHSPSLETQKEVYDLTSESLSNINSAAETTSSPDIAESTPVAAESPHQEPHKDDSNQKRKTRGDWDAGLRRPQRDWEIEGEQQFRAEKRRKAEEAALLNTQRIAKKLKTAHPSETTSMSQDKAVKQRVPKAKAPRKRKASNVQGKGGVQLPDKSSMSKSTESEDKETNALAPEFEAEPEKQGQRESNVIEEDEETNALAAEIEAELEKPDQSESNIIEEDEEDEEINALTAEIEAELEKDDQRESNVIEEVEVDKEDEEDEETTALAAEIEAELEKDAQNLAEGDSDDLDSLFME